MLSDSRVHTFRALVNRCDESWSVRDVAGLAKSSAATNLTRRSVESIDEVMKSHSHRHQMQFILIWFVFQFSLAEHDMNFFRKKKSSRIESSNFPRSLFHLSSIPPLERQQQHFWIDFDGDARTSPEKFLSPLFFTHKTVDTFSLVLLGLQWPSVSVVRWWWWAGVRPAHIDDYIGLQTALNRTSQPQKSNHHRHGVAAAQHWVCLLDRC